MEVGERRDYVSTGWALTRTNNRYSVLHNGRLLAECISEEAALAAKRLLSGEARR